RRRSLYRSAPPATYVRTLSLHDALPFSSRVRTNDFKYRPLYESTRTVVDEKDFQILARLARDPFASNEGIGGSLGLSGNSIKRRIESLVAEGVVPGTWLFPIPQIFRRHSRIFVYRDMAKPEAAIDVALRADPIVWAGFDVDRSFHAHAYATTPDAAPPPELVKALGEPSFAVSPPFSGATATEAAVSSKVQPILSALPRCRLITTRTTPPGVWLIGWANSMAEVADVDAHLRGLPGVERSGIIMRQRVDFAVERVEGWIQEDLARWGKAQRTGVLPSS